MDAFSMSISVGLQYGIPLEFYVSKFSNLRFEPAGMTDDPDVRIATSVMDYLFRRLALDHLPYEKRAQLGIFSAEERTAQVAESYGGREVDLEELRSGVEHDTARPRRRGQPRAGGGAQLHRAAGAAPGQGRRRAAVHDLRHEDAPGRVVLRLRGLRLHQRLQLSAPVHRRASGAAGHSRVAARVGSAQLDHRRRVVGGRSSTVAVTVISVSVTCRSGSS
jgi:hypothetical protein